MIHTDASLPQPVPTPVYIPLRSMLLMAFFVAVIYMLIHLVPLILMLFFAIMLAVTIYPLFVNVMRRGVPRWAAVTLVVTAVFGAGLLLIVLVIPSLLEQASTLLGALPALHQKFLSQIALSPAFKGMEENLLNQLAKFDSSRILVPLASAGQLAINGMVQVVFVLVFAIYFMLDGSRMVRWLLAFFSAGTREKLEATAQEMSKVISAYVSAQVVTSVVCGVYTLVILTFLQVPGAFMLATLAAIFDVLPVLGFFLAIVPAFLLALTVSPMVALLVVVLYVFYHVIESYFLVPKIYGSSMRLSDLTVLLSLIVAVELGGVLGAIAVLPLVASYPMIERIWLVDFLGRGVVRKHAASAAAENLAQTLQSQKE